MVDIVAGTPASVAYSGSAVDYVATSDGQLELHLWGGAGSGGYYANGSGNANKYGGSGGYTYVRFMVETGDTITLEVGQGGQVPAGSGTTAANGGAGGWPDGGFGGKSSSGAWVGLGGGGGSTRVYKNGILVAVAGGGGGATGFYSGGNGGGASGLASTDASSGAPGTQTAGGTAGSGTLAVQSGGYFRAGVGGTTSSTAHAYAGGGGGGGYYGGASNGGGSGAHGSGGGGSGWINQSTEYAGATRCGPQDNLGTPFDVVGIRPAGVAQGGTGPTVASTGWGSITPGGNGFAYLSLVNVADSISTLAFPTSGTTTVAYTGSRVTYEVEEFCSVDIEAWGGGGGGGFYTSGGNAARFGGASGYIAFTRFLYPGDIVEIEVAQGGQSPSGVSQTGGAGGWPNGGHGGRPSAGTPNFAGGGGSTNIYVNGRLVGVAAGGGGSTGFYYGGAGGTRYGLQSTDATAANGTGGTWGGNGSGLNRGYYLLGGSGSPVESPTIVSVLAGAGGGGGYWGGGGARGGSGTHGSGGGGASYINGDNTYNRVMQPGVANTGVSYNTANRPAGVGQGGVGGSSALTSGPGGNGACVLTVTSMGTVTELPTTKTTLDFSGSGAAQHYVANTYGFMQVKLWGAGGGGCTRASGTTKRGGGGGFLQLDIVKYKPGDILTFVVGEGGKGMPGANLGGRGGFPNGEAGNAGDATGGNAGGGGSSHFYLNGKLIGVSGGGAGGAISFDGQSAGLPANAPNSNGFAGHGGTLDYGGWCVQRAAEGTNRGVFMLAGQGFYDGQTLDTPNNTGGGGGGGGYYGGGGACPGASRFWGGGGGSTYLDPSYLGNYIQGVANGANTTDADWSTGISVGGQGSLTVGNPLTNGGHGRIVFNPLNPLPLDESVTSSVPVASVEQAYIAGSDGDLVLDLWGAGGGAGMITAGGGGERGGGGGYLAGKVSVKKGSIIRFHTGRGGGGATYTSGGSGAFVGAGGAGGWPDGGTGGFNSAGIFGGGGGSSRVYVDEQLVMVAGAGGGLGDGTVTRTPGGGGGLTGGQSDAPAGFNSGGTQLRGGTSARSATDLTSGGAFLRGGSGFDATTNSSTVSTTHAGGGGGGGYFGGAGSGNGGVYIGGAGGSSWLFDGIALTDADPDRPFTLAQWSFENTFAEDGRRLQLRPVDTAPTITTTGPKYGTACANLNGGHLTATLPRAFGEQTYTIEGWFNPTSLATGVLFALGDAGLGGVSLHYSTGTTLTLRHNSDGATDQNYVDSTRAANVWAHYAIVRDCVNNGTRVYKDGKLVINYVGVAFTVMTATQFTLGNYTSAAGGSTRFTGKIDEVRVTLGTNRYLQNFSPRPFRNSRTDLVPTVTTNTQGSNGASGNPAGMAVSGYITGRGVGAQNRTTTGNAPNGGDGQINYFIASSTVTASGPIGTVSVAGFEAVAGASYDLPAPGQQVVESFISARTNYLATAPGVTRVKIEMWGAGGGGCSSNSTLTTNGGGGGGYTTYEVDLNQGDRITVQTPSGGGGAVNANGTNPGGAGGYPNGGKGYRPATTTFDGGGGGSAQLWVRGVLAAVAGGGGGNSYGSASADYAGGAGGGASGGNGYNDLNGGGSQTVGGNGTGNGQSGSFLQGGHGGTAEGVAGNGAGGGGGYYGGGGGGPGFGGSAGGGGSGYVNTSISGYRTGLTVGGSGNQAGGMASPNYVSGIGIGSNGKGGAQLHGGNGRIVISVITPTNGNASGDVGTINVSGLDTTGTLIGTPRGNIGTVTVVPPVGQSGQPAFPTGALPVVEMRPPEVIPTATATVIVPINDNQSITISPVLADEVTIPIDISGAIGTVTITPPSATVTAGVNVTGVISGVLITPPEGTAEEIPPVFASGDIGTVTVESLEATTEVIPPVYATGDIGTITLSSPEGEVDVNHNVVATGDIGTIALAAPDAAAQGDHNATGDIGTVTVTGLEPILFLDAEGTGDIGTITVTPPDGGQPADALGQDLGYIQVVTPGATTSVSTEDQTTLFADIGTVFVAYPRGQGFYIGDDNFVHALPDPLVVEVTQAPQGTATGQGRANQPLPVITVSSPLATAGGDAHVEAYTGDFIILSTPPIPIIELAANLSVAMPAPIVINGNDAEASNEVTLSMPGPITVTGPDGEGFGAHGGDLATITVTAPEGGPQVAANASGEIGTILLAAPLSIRMPDPIIVSPPQGQALDAKSAEASGEIPGPITIGVPTPGYQTAVAINLPLPVVNVLPPQPLIFSSVAISGNLSNAIVVTPPAASVTAIGTASGSLNTITVTAPEATATPGTAGYASGDLSTITLTPPAGMGVVSVPGNASGTIGTITVTAPAASLSAGADFSRAIGTITVTAPNAVGRVSVSPSGDLSNAIVVTSPEGYVTTGAIQASGLIGTITVTAPDATATGRASVSKPIGTITVTTPTGSARSEVDKNVPLPTIIVNPPAGVAGIEGIASGDLSTITISSPQGTATPGSAGYASGDLSTAITLTPPSASVTHGRNFSVPLPGPITVNPPLAEGQGGVLVDGSAELTVTIIPPQPLLYKEVSVIVGFPTIFVQAPQAITYTLAEFASIIVTVPDAYVTAPLADGAARIRYRRKNVTGYAPGALLQNEIALNEADGALFSRDGSGAVKKTPLGYLTGDGVPPEFDEDGKILSGGLSWDDPAPLYSLPARAAPAGSRIALADGIIGHQTFAPVSGTTYTRPFFVSNALDVTALSVEVVDPAPATAEIGIVEWSLTGTPGATLASGTVSAATAGLKTAPGTAISLLPGWYAATFTVTGADGSTYRSSIAPTAISPDFTTTPGAPAPVMAELDI